eukprot:TRINITY_DN45725_c0_g1_i1.p1 TRINITY_DN45725_c0_g1~~TRINITY_DN45725_c0_g1_i1.p1  ORF type:complete len:100 (-),score=19.08 TRINITY_DN45725_c0_g1_i1:204-503(-)
MCIRDRLVTVHSIGGWHVLDCNLEEEECSDANLVVACTPNQATICGVSMGGQKGITPSELLGMVKEAQTFGKVLLGSLHEFLKQEEVLTEHGPSDSMFF